MRRLALLGLPICAFAISACATATSTSKFHGTEHSVAQTIANLQADVTAGEQKKICTNDLAAGVVRKLGGPKGCEAALKRQLVEVDSTDVTVESVQIKGTTATATVTSTIKGKKNIKGTVMLVEEGSKWKISSLQ